MTFRLIAADEPPAALARRREGKSGYVIAVDHASRRVPRRLGNLGLTEAELARHIAWDIGALAVAEGVSAALDAPLVAQNYSRLVIDCNRRPGDPSSIPLMSESTAITGNIDVSEEHVDARQREIFDPYHQHLHGLLDERARAGQRTILIVQHSMTDVFMGVRREMHAAVLYDRDAFFARCLLNALRTQPGLIVGDNQPYSGKERVGFTIPHHGESRGIPAVEVEVRQDLIASSAGQQEWIQRMVTVLRMAEKKFLAGPA